MGFVPLGYRLPNPPPLFVGRDTETGWLAEAIQRGRLTAVVGAGGVGKTALVLQTLHRHFPDQVSDTLFIGLRPGVSGQLRQEVVRALAEAQMVTELDWSSLLRNPERMATLAIDLAENEPSWIVLDNLHNAQIDEAREFIEQVTDYARASRWIVATRVDPMLEGLTGQVLSLGPMGDDELARLAQHAAPALGDDDVQRAVEEAQGSPWRLWRAVERSQLGAEAKEGRFLDTLPAAAAGFVRALWAVHTPLPLELVHEFCEVPGDDLLDGLERRGVIEPTAAGTFRLHDAARNALGDPLDDRGAVQAGYRAAEALATHDEPPLLLEAARLYRERGHDGQVEQLLARAGDRLLAAGYAQQLWNLLADMDQDRAGRWRLYCAVEIADRDALSRLRPTPSPTLKDRFVWARALFLRGELETAADEAERVEAAASEAGDSRLAFSAGFLRARALAPRGDANANAAMEQLEKLDPPDAAAGVRRDARLALVATFLGQHERALEIADRVRPQLASLPGPDRVEAVSGLAGVIGRYGSLRDAQDLVNRALESAEDETAAGMGELHYVAAGCALRRGDIVRATKHIEVLERSTEGAARLHRHVLVLDTFRRILVGELGGVDEQINELVAEPGGTPSTYRGIAGVAFQVRVLRGRPPTKLAPSDRDPIRGGRGIAELWRLRRLVRLGEPGVPTGAIHVADADYADTEAPILTHLVRAEAHLAQGNPDDALTELRTSIERAREVDFLSWEIEARHTECDAMILLDRPAELARVARQLAEMAERFESQRFAREAALFAAMAEKRPPRPAELEVWASQPDVAPVAARRARALLGDAPFLDEIDRRVLAALGYRLSWWRPLQRVSDDSIDAAWKPGWGLDEHREEVWLPGGRVIDFQSRPVLWRVLVSLAEHGGEATKEQIVCAAWDEAEYHPLRHDNRLHAAVRKLRQLVEEGGPRPTRVITTETGYKLGDHAKRRRA